MHTLFNDPIIGETRVDLIDIAAYAEASGDHNPIHLDAAAAQEAGFPRQIAHGMLTMGLAHQLILAASRQPLQVIDYQVTFRDPLLVGDGFQVEISQVEARDDSCYQIKFFATSLEGDARIMTGQLLCQVG